jgi:hypothetical protein
MASRYNTSWVSYNSADKPKTPGTAGRLALTGAASGRSYNLVPLLNSTLAGTGVGWYDDTPISEQDWPTHPNYRPGIEWTNDLTEAISHHRAKTYDIEKRYEQDWNRATTLGKIAGTTSKYLTMFVADEVNLIPIGGQLVKAGSVLNNVRKAVITGAKWGAAYGGAEALLTNPARKVRGQDTLSGWELAGQASAAVLFGGAALGTISGIAAGVRNWRINKANNAKLIRDSLDVTPDETAPIVEQATKNKTAIDQAINQNGSKQTQVETDFASQQWTAKSINDAGGKVMYDANGRRTVVLDSAKVIYELTPDGKILVRTKGLRTNEIKTFKKNILNDEFEVYDSMSDVKFPARQGDYEFVVDKDGQPVFEEMQIGQDTINTPKKKLKDAKDIIPRDIVRKIFFKKDKDQMLSTRKDEFEFTSYDGKRQKIVFDDFGNPKLFQRTKQLQGKATTKDIFLPIEQVEPGIKNPDLYAKITFMNEIGIKRFLGPRAKAIENIAKRVRRETSEQKLDALKRGENVEINTQMKTNITKLDYKDTEIDAIFNKKELTHDETVQQIKDEVASMAPEDVAKAKKKILKKEKDTGPLVAKLDELTNVDDNIKLQAVKDIEVLLKDMQIAKQDTEWNINKQMEWVKNQRQIRNRDVDGVFEYLKNKDNAEWTFEAGEKRTGVRTLFFIKDGKLFKTSKKTLTGAWDKSPKYTTNMNGIAELIDQHFYTLNKNQTYESLLKAENGEGEEYLKCAISEILKLY